MKGNLVQFYLVLAVAIFALSCGQNPSKNNQTEHLISAGPIKSISNNISRHNLQKVLKVNKLNKIDNFYLKFEKAKLDQRYIIGGYFSNSSVPMFDLISLRAKVVKFAQRGTKLYMLDASPNRSFTSTTASYQLIDAFPIVDETETHIMVDFTESENEFSFSSESNVKGLTFSKGILHKQVSMLNNLYYEGETAIFENILSLYSEERIWDPEEFLPQGNPNELTIKLTYFIKPYKENKTFKPRKAWKKVGYFKTDKQFITKNTLSGFSGEYIEDYIVRWDISKKPQTWYYTRNWPSQYVSSLQKTIAAWNKLLKKEFFKLEKAPKEMNIDDPTKNIFIWSETQRLAIAAAYATMINDPITGEILNAKIVIFGNSILGTAARLYQGKIWEVPEKTFVPDPKPKPTPKKVRQTIKAFEEHKHANSLPYISLGNWKANHLCIHPLHKNKAGSKTPAGKYVTKYNYLSFANFSERLITATLLHEMGHTLGLRHNFKGSLIAEDKIKPTKEIQTTSIMDYMPLHLDYLNVHLGTYDAVAIEYGYFGTKATKVPEFCTDGDVNDDPYCNRFDAGDPYEFYLQNAEKLFKEPIFLALSGLNEVASLLFPIIGFAEADTKRKKDALDYLTTFLLLDIKHQGMYPGIGIKIDIIKGLLISKLFYGKKLHKALSDQDKKAWYNLISRIIVDMNNLESTSSRILGIEGLIKIETDMAYEQLNKIHNSLFQKIRNKDESKAKETSDWVDNGLWQKIGKALTDYY